MAAIALKLDTSEIERFTDESPKRIRRACARSINRGLASGKTVVKRGIAKETGLPVKAAGDALPLHQATPDRLQGYFTSSPKRVPLFDFKARGPFPSRGLGTGVTYALASSKSGGHLEHAFIAAMRSGHKGVFLRNAKARLGIHELYGPSIAAVFAKYEPAGRARAQESLETNLAHELARIADNLEVSDVFEVTADAE